MSDTSSATTASTADAASAQKKPKAKLGNLARLVRLVAPHRVRFYIATLALLVGSGAGLVYPQALRWFVDEGLAAGSLENLNLVAGGVLAVFALQSLVVWVRHYLMSWLGERAVADLRRLVFERLLGLSPGWFHERRTGELVGRLASDVTVVEGVVGSELSIALRNLVQLVGGLVLLFVENARLTGIMLAIVPPLSVGVVLFGKKIRQMSKAVQDRLAEASAEVQENVAAIETVQAFGREKHALGVYTGGVEGAFAAALSLTRWRASFISTVSLAGYLAVTFIVWVGGSAVIKGELSGGDLAAFLLYTVMVATSLGSIANLWGTLQRAAGATERLFEVIDAVPDIRDPEVPAALPSGGGHVQFEGVNFTYPTRPDRQVLHGVDLELSPGESVAIVGPSGAGKSTLTALLFRFFDPESGSVYLDGADVRTLRLAELRRELAIVAQEPVLFSGTIRDNIAYGNPTASADAVEQAARDANAHDFITGFEHGYDTEVGDRGVKLSGGQKQRIAIARAIIADPRVLILDEATSSLDAESEAAVQEALTRLMRGRTTLVVAHRLSTVRDADRIVVLEAGHVKETGTHDALMAEQGLYHRLVHHQLA